MSSYDPPNEILPIFNPVNYLYALNATMTEAQADLRYLKLSGGIETGPVLFMKTLSVVENSFLANTSVVGTLTANTINTDTLNTDSFVANTFTISTLIVDNATIANSSISNTTISDSSVSNTTIDITSITNCSSITSNNSYFTNTEITSNLLVNDTITTNYIILNANSTITFPSNSIIGSNATGTLYTSVDTPLVINGGIVVYGDIQYTGNLTPIIP